MSGIELFLTKQIFTREEHPRHWDQFVYDDENIHYGILRILCEGSPTFAQKFLMLSVVPKHVSINRLLKKFPKAVARR